MQRHHRVHASGAQARAAARPAPMGAAPLAASQGSWRTPAAAPVKRRFRRLARRSLPLTNIGRSPHTPWRAVIGGQGLSTLSGLASGASRPSLGRGARPSFLPARGGAAEPKHASCALPAPAPRPRATLVPEGTSPMNQTARTLGTVPACGKPNPAGREITPEAQQTDHPGTAAAFGAYRLSHHLATAATATSPSALATSNHSDMAAH